MLSVFLIAISAQLTLAINLQGLILKNYDFSRYNSGNAVTTTVDNAVSVEQATAECAQFARQHNHTRFRIDSHPNNPYFCQLNGHWQQGDEFQLKTSKLAVCDRGYCHGVGDYEIYDDMQSPFAGVEEAVISGQAVSFEAAVEAMAVHNGQAERENMAHTLEWYPNIWFGFRGIAQHQQLLPGHISSTVLLAADGDDQATLTDMSCSSKHVSEAQMSLCSQFEYEAGDVVEPPQDLMPEFPASRRFAKIHSSYGYEVISYRYNLQSLSHYLTFDSATLGPLFHNLDTISQEYYSFTADQAYDKCAQFAVYQPYRTFNLVYRKSGWTCTTYFKEGKALGMTVPDPTAIHSWLYSADHSQKDEL